MKKHKKLIICAVSAAVAVAAVFIGILAAAGWTFDVIGKCSLQSFKSVAEYAQTYDEDDVFTLRSPDGTAEFYYKNQAVGIRTDLAPFIAAGLDSSALPAEYTLTNDVLTFEREYNRTILGYHSSMGHFNLNFGNDNLFEWAQDVAANDKDIVFALNPEPLISAGVSPESVEGWLYDKVEMHENGKTVERYMFLKPFNLA